MRLLAGAFLALLAAGCTMLGTSARDPAAPPAPREASGSRCAEAELVTPRFGFAVCSGRLLVWEAARGWREAARTRGTPGISDAEFLDARRGWFVAYDCARGRARVHRTSDGGASWRSVAVPPTNCSAGSRLELAFAGPSRGALVNVHGNGNTQRLSATADGGTSWTRAYRLPGAGSVALSRDAVWLGRMDVVPGGSGLFTSHDGGATWRGVPLGSPVAWGEAGSFPGVPRFFGGSGVVAVSLADGSRTSVAFHTTEDRGATWSLAAVRSVRATVLSGGSPFVEHVAAGVASPSVWWIADRGASWVTTDAGRRWTRQPSPMNGGAAASISAADARHAWLLVTARGGRTTLFSTSDAGRTWRRVVPRPR